MNIKRKVVFASILALLLMLCAALLGLNVVKTSAAAAEDGQFTVESVSAYAGDTVEVDITIDSNPGVAVVLLAVTYDSDLTLVGVTDAGILGSYVHGNDYSANPYRLYWNNNTITENITATGTIVTLTFAVSNSAAVEKHAVEVSFDLSRYDIMDVDMNTVAFDVTNGGVTVLCDHVWGEWTNNMSGNNHQRVCEKCGEPQYAAHDWGNGEEVLAPSCTEEGSQEYTCSVCNATKTETVSSLGHVMTYHAQVDATCTQAGSIAYYSCSRCGKNFSDKAGETELDDTSITALGHTMTYHAQVDATCTQAGSVAYYKCLRCEKNFSDQAGGVEVEDLTIAPLGHTMTYHAQVDATCTQAGTVAYYSCSRCGKNFSDEAGETELDDTSITALGHRWDEEWTCGDQTHWHACLNDPNHRSDEASHTATDDGNCLTEVVCECGFVVQEAYSEHNFGDEWQHDTMNHWQECQNSGCNVSTQRVLHSGGTATCSDAPICSVCHVAYDYPLGHTMTEHPQVDATCINAGTIAYWSCSRCGKNFSDQAGETEVEDLTIAPLGHAMTYHAQVEATCTADGVVAYYNCSRCGKNFSDENGQTEISELTIPSFGHDWSEEWSRDEDGHWHVCLNDALHRSEVLDHVAGDPATETTPQVCTVCGYIIAPALGHTTHVADTSRWYSDETSHWHVCQGCNLRMDIANHIGGQATCTERAVCEVCLNVYGTPLGHEMVYHAQVDATCEQEGSIAYYSCANCDKNFSDIDGRVEIDNLTIPALGHNWSEEWSCNASEHWHACLNDPSHRDDVSTHIAGEPATETSPQICIVCEYIIAPATGHVHELIEVEAVSATCTTGGNIAYYVCEACEQWFYDQDAAQEIADHDRVLTDPLGHDVEHVEQVSATEASEGNIEYWHCTRCGKYFADQALSEEITEEETILARVPPNNGSVEQPSDNGPSIWLIVTIVVVCVIVIVCIVVIVTKKRRK